MESRERALIDGADVEEEQVLRLRAVLHDLVRRKGRVEAARGLGLYPRTVGACVDGEGMSWRVREALERAFQGDQGESAAQQREQMGALERRVEALEKRMISHLEGVEDGNGVHGEKHAKGNRQAERGPGVQGVAKPPATATGEARAPVRNVPGRRLYPDLVAREPAPGDEEVYGEAWPLIDEWREIWKAGHRGTGKGLAWLRTEERVRALEVAMLEEHGHLQPEKMPLYGLDRRDQLVWRKEALCEVRKALAWAELRR